MRLNSRTAKPFGVAVAAALAALSLTACGGQSDAQFNAAFDKSTHDSCVTSAGSHGLPAAQVEAYCTCFVKEADKLSVPDKMALPAHEEKITAMAQTCLPLMTGAAPASNAP